MRTRILGYKFESESAKLLADSLNTKRIRPDGLYKYKEDDLIINLGFSGKPIWDNNHVAWLNKPENVAIAVCKKKTFNKLKEKGVSIPDFTESKEVAAGWINEGNRVVCRKILNGHSGAGIVVAHNINELVDAPLYSKYFPKRKEFRVHVVHDKEGLKIFDFIEKRKKAEIPKEEMNYEIRNHGQWIFARGEVELPDCVKKEAIKAVDAIGLELSSVDIVYDVKNDKCVVLEVNTNSSLSGDTTLENYTKAIKSILDDKVVVPAAIVPALVPVPAAQVKSAPAPIQTPQVPIQPLAPVATPISKAIEKVKENKKEYSFEGASQIRTVIEGKKMKFYGTIPNVSKQVKIMETEEGEVTYFWQD